MVTRDDCQVVDRHVQPPVLSDHGLIVATIPFIHQPALYITRQIRHWKSLERDAFADALRDHPLFSNIEATPALTVTQLFDSYSTVTSELLDVFLPVRTVKSRHCPLTPWFDAECRLRRRQARRLERVFRRTQLAGDKTTWIHFVRNMHDFYRRREQNYWETLIVDQRILRGSGRRSMASLVAARILAVSRRQLPLQLMLSLRRLLPRSHPSVMPLPLLHHRFICPPAINVSPPSEKSQVLSCACSSWLLLRKPVNLTRCLHS